MSNFKSASIDLKFSVDLVHRIIRPMVKRLAESDCWFNIYVFLGENGQINTKNPIAIKTIGPIELTFSP